MKVAIEEFDRFWDEVLGADWYDDGEGETAGVDVVDLDGVVPRWGGSGRPAPSEFIKERDIDRVFLSVNTVVLFRRWKKKQTTTTVVASFDVPNDQVPALLEQIKALKGRVRS